MYNSKQIYMSHVFKRKPNAVTLQNITYQYILPGYYYTYLLAAIY